VPDELAEFAQGGVVAVLVHVGLDLLGDAGTAGEDPLVDVAVGRVCHRLAVVLEVARGEAGDVPHLGLEPGGRGGLLRLVLDVTTGLAAECERLADGVGAVLVDGVVRVDDVPRDLDILFPSGPNTIPLTRMSSPAARR